MDPRFPDHKPEDADLSKVEGYTGHPGQERVKADLTSQHETFSQDKKNNQDLDKKNFNNNNDQTKNDSALKEALKEKDDQSSDRQFQKNHK